jgi:hypothetical protein
MNSHATKAAPSLTAPSDESAGLSTREGAGRTHRAGANGDRVPKRVRGPLDYIHERAVSDSRQRDRPPAPCRRHPLAHKDGGGGGSQGAARLSLSAPVASGSMLEAQGIGYAVDQVEHERDVGGLGQRVVLDPGGPAGLNVGRGYGVRVARERLHEGRAAAARGLKRPCSSRVGASRPSSFGGDHAVRTKAELAAVGPGDHHAANSSRSPTDHCDGPRKSEGANRRNRAPHVHPETVTLPHTESRTASDEISHRRGQRYLTVVVCHHTGPAGVGRARA